MNTVLRLRDEADRREVIAELARRGCAAEPGVADRSSVPSAPPLARSQRAEVAVG